MIDYKTFKLNDNAIVRIRTDKIIATVHGEGNGVDIYCTELGIPFHVQATGQPSDYVLKCLWGDED